MKTTVTVLDSLEVFRFSVSNQAFPAHYHETYCVSLIHQGVLLENDAVGTPGTILISHPYEVHANQPLNDDPYRFSTFYVSPDLMAHAAGRAGVVFKQKAIEDAAAFAALQAALQRAEGSVSAFERLLEGILGRLARRYSAPGAELRADALVEETKARILDRLDAPIRLEELAAERGTSKFAFIRWFKKHTGMTPYHFVTLHRVEAGKALLREGCEVSQTALEVGFYDQSHFTTFFRRFVGLTPSAYRSAISYKRSAAG